jgi:hypothetical protein
MISTTTSSDDSILLSQENRNLQEYTLGVLFSSPIVGKDIHGKYHPIAVRTTVLN